MQPNTFVEEYLITLPKVSTAFQRVETMEFYIQWLFNKILAYEKYYTNGSKEKHELNIFHIYMNQNKAKWNRIYQRCVKETPNITEV